MSQQKRLIVAANRLPVTITVDDVGFEFKQSPGGLVTALSALKSDYDLSWIGWPGEVDLSMVDPEGIEEQLKREYNAIPIFLPRRLLQRYYYGFSNKVLWPVLHYLPTHIDYDERDFQAYKEVNEIFAQKVLDQATGMGEDDIIWIHDYQLMLVPGMIREKLPKAKIGWFLHTPFPSSEVFRALPYREELLSGIMGASLAGFHTFSYVRHFRSSLLHILGIDSEINHVDMETHRLNMSAFPISIDVARTQETVESKEIEDDLQIVRNISAGRKIILSVDRLDYTKGLPDRLHAYKKFLMRNQHLIRDVVLVQIAVPSRTQISDYQDLKNEVETIVFDIQETFEHAERAPIHFIYRSLPFKRLCAFYMEADIALVTPYFDGMNLVAKEFVAVKRDRGVLILSEHAGAAHELGEALIINPWNPDQICLALEEALNMNEGEQQRRMDAMYAKIHRNDIHYWSNSFLRALLESQEEATSQTATTVSLDAAAEENLISEFKKAEKPIILLDYDGTLAEITNLPMNARPDRELLELLTGLTALENVEVAVVSGRGRKDIIEFLGSIQNISFSTEHGLWIKWRHEQDWHRMITGASDAEWFEAVRDLFDQYNLSTPGSFTEEKEASLAWHYRLSDPAHGQWKARELIMNLNNVLANTPLEVVSGKCVVEVRHQGVHKGNILSRIQELDLSYDMTVAFGDDTTDEYLFDALPRSAYTVKVGKDLSHARYRVNGVRDVRRILGKLRAARQS